jgi:sulfur-oxidizing protein SoxX
MRTIGISAAALAAAVLVAVAAAPAQQKSDSAPSPADAAVAASWSKLEPEWQARLSGDQSMRECSAHKNAPPNALVLAIQAREKAAIQYPPDGNLMGDWRKGERLAQSGYGQRFTDYPPTGPNGGNCYACHQLQKKELSFGTVGPSLLEYGKARKFAPEEVKAVYERIYNPQAFTACGLMPRFGHHKVLTIEQIKDIVAYVMSPDSPVNK